ncbi:hypothetical protein TGME49_311155 [Toxoplasma gondii ME49]|uniref:Uncharacterized protein n=10 Tax=Toxoplasma gondii TaxID=5811 RepID=A0A125YPA8_TOXGV|nr:hypothetical protein TGME49_311155 [Toxoplasma gondii ME49]EPT26116.1 hypothetical protein TGME49_311155 [Toxoplasma gondii ME49]ESS34912.1 hypothetical protein TGVEG_311155 [Toxoplasma gondii VEG]KYF47829.1 hypothetical protein TGARI_311155 [Toxoplasma gondii ARI]|eukprot:XP_018635536.1 hypothetical protein TGME49_311155 [Toxoplasma gondii ME49]
MFRKMAHLLRLFNAFLQQQLSATVYSFLVNNHTFQNFAVHSSRKAAELKAQVTRSVEDAVKQAVAGNARPSSSSNSSFSSPRGRREGEGSEPGKLFLTDGKAGEAASARGFFSDLKKRFFS